MAPSRVAAVLPEPVSPELALVDPILRRQLLTALSHSPVESPPAQTLAPKIPSAGGRHAQERLGYVVAGVALTIGCAIGLVVTLPHRGTTNARPAPIANPAGQPSPVVTPPLTPPAVTASAPVVAAITSSETSVQRGVRPTKAPARLDPFLPPDSADALPGTASSAG